MLKKITIAIIFLLFSNITFSQETKKEETNNKVNLGKFTKFADTKLGKVKSIRDHKPEARIRKHIFKDAELIFVYQVYLQYPENNNYTLSFDYIELAENIEAIKILKEDEKKDIALNPDYLENSYTTKNGIDIAYNISKGKSQWCLSFKSNVWPSTVSNGDDLLTDFVNAKAKIEELKK